MLAGGVGLAAAAVIPSRAFALPATLPADWGTISRQYLVEWEANRGDHPYLADFTRSGYKAGTQPLPSVTDIPRKADVTAYGAKGDGTTDDYAAFANAIKAVSGQGGVVVVPAGRYLISRPLIVTANNVVIAGASSEATTLYFPNTMADSFRNGFNNGNSVYSWFAGQVWFTSQRLVDSFPARENEHWVPGATTWAVNEAKRGATQLTVAAGHNIVRGSVILLELDVTSDASLLKTMCGNVGGADTYNWAAAESLLPGPLQYADRSKYQWPVRVTEVTGNTISIAERTHLPIKAGWNPRVSVLSTYIRDVGVQGITIENKVIKQTTHNNNPGSNGVCFSHVIDGWARDVRVLNVDVGFNFTATKHCTLHDVSVGGRACHHPFACRVQAHDNVVEYFTIEKPTVPLVAGAQFHGINVEGYSSGNVWRQGDMRYGLFDSHRAVPFDILRTAIRVEVNGTIGGGSHAGPNYGCRATHWGVEVLGTSGRGVLVDDCAPRALMVGIRGTTAASGAASAIPSPRESKRHLFQGALNPFDGYLAQRQVAGLKPEPTPLAPRVR